MNSPIKNDGKPSEMNMIDENKLQEFDQEVSNYLDEMYLDVEKHPQNDNNFNQYSPDYQSYNYNQFANQNQTNNDFYQRRLLEYENQQMNLLQENEKLNKKIEEYQKLNREWEAKVYNIKKVLNELEEKKNNYKEETEKLKEENDQLSFKLKLSMEKEKIHETGVKNLKEIEAEYESKMSDLKREFKNKEENLRKKYEILEENTNGKVKDLEEEYSAKVKKLENQLKEANKTNRQLEKTVEEFKDKLVETERFFQTKEEEFEDLLSTKDKKMKELELCIKSISNEANSQISKLSDSVSEFNDKINYYKNREMQITQEYLNLKNYIKNNQSQINHSHSLIEVNDPNLERMQTQNSSASEGMSNNRKKSFTSIEANVDYSKSKTIDTLRNKVKELEEENISLSRELNLKYEECETMNEELRMAYEAIKASETNSQFIIKEKDDQVTDLTNKINELDIIISKYGQNLIEIKKSMEKCNYDHQMEILKKNDELRQMEQRYEKKIRELQVKIEEILLKENKFIQSLNINETQNTKLDKNQYLSNNSYMYVPKEIPDDEEVRKNINEQINFIKQKLNRSKFS